MVYSTLVLVFEEEAEEGLEKEEGEEESVKKKRPCGGVVTGKGRKEGET